MLAEEYASMQASEPPEDDAEAVLRALEESGVFDELRQQLLTCVKTSVSLVRTYKRVQGLL